MSKSIILILLCVFTETLSFQCPVREFYPDPSDSSNYYECVKGEATHMACPDGHLFDEAARMCAKPDSSSETSPFKCPENDGVYPDATDCTKYFKCVIGQATNEVCPDGETFNTDNRVCDDTGTCSSTDSSSEASAFKCSEKDGNYPDSTDCTKYFKCVSGQATNEVCPKGETFNPDINDCDATGKCSSTDSSSETSAFKCPKKDRTYPNTADCTKFYKCVNGQASNMICTYGLTFNEDINDCDNTGKCSSTDSSSAKYKIVCYFTTLVEKLNKEAKFTPSQIDPFLCTHIIYASARLDENSYTIEMAKSDVDEGYYKDMMNLKKKNPNLKVMLSLGGYEDLHPTTYSYLAGIESARKNINSNAVAFLQKYGFDGLDLYWDYPSCTRSQCEDNSKDKENFATWLKELRTLFDQQSPKLLLSVAVSPVVTYIDKAYDIPTMTSALDFINVPGYGYSEFNNGVTAQNAPLNASPGTDPNLTVAATMTNWKEKVVSPDKLILGFPAYGVSFTLKNSENHSFGSPIVSPGDPGPITRKVGELAYFEICEYLKQGWTKGGDNEAGPFAYSKDQWVGYDDPKAVERKAQFIKDHGYGGAMIFDITLDDHKGGCCGVNFPLLSVVNNVLNGKGKPLSVVTCK